MKRQMKRQMKQAARAHALLSASGSKRWMACPPSAHLEELFPNKDSFASREGTLAHELGEHKVLLWCAESEVPVNGAALDPAKCRADLALFLLRHAEGKAAPGEPCIDRQMDQATDEYLHLCVEVIQRGLARSQDAVVMLEARLDFSRWVPEGFGSGDLVVVSDGLVEVVDLKYGKGVPVFAAENPQMRLYGLGAIELYGHLYDQREIRMTICQPRLDSQTSEELTVEALIAWADAEVAPRAQLAWNNEGEFAAGDHCKFCRARHQCRARADAALAGDPANYDWALMEDEEIRERLAQAHIFEKWLKDMNSYVFERVLKNGGRAFGMKMVHGRSARVYTDRDAVLEKLCTAGLSMEVVTHPRELLGITDLEKVVGKKRVGELLKDLITKPKGKLTLADENDPRELADLSEDGAPRVSAADEFEAD